MATTATGANAGPVSQDGHSPVAALEAMQGEAAGARNTQVGIVIHHVHCANYENWLSILNHFVLVILKTTLNTLAVF